ncbi:uncharacterized protein METZ01_LOCUS313421, partial [marine metagenome]
QDNPKYLFYRKIHKEKLHLNVNA